MSKLNKYSYIVLAIIGLIITGCGQKGGNSTIEQTDIKPQEIELAKQEPLEELLEQSEEQRLIEKEQRERQLLIEQKQILEKALLFFDKPFDAYSHCKTEADIQNLLGLFGAWAALIKARENSDDAEVQRLAKQLKDKVIKCQSEAFPILRQEYPRVINNKIKVTHDKLGFIDGSEVDYITMQTKGNRSTYATFTWWGFVADKNNAIFQRQIFDTLTILRFTQAKLQSDVYDSEPSIFIPFKGKDSDLIILK